MTLPPHVRSLKGPSFAAKRILSARVLLQAALPCHEVRA
jgi:hypothetical protein